VETEEKDSRAVKPQGTSRSQRERGVETEEKTAWLKTSKGRHALEGERCGDRGERQQGCKTSEGRMRKHYGEVASLRRVAYRIKTSYCGTHPPGSTPRVGGAQLVVQMGCGGARPRRETSHTAVSGARTTWYTRRFVGQL